MRERRARGYRAGEQEERTMKIKGITSQDRLDFDAIYIYAAEDAELEATHAD